MNNITITNNDTTKVVIKDAVFKDDILTVAGAGTTAEGTILARDSATGKLIPYVKGGTTNENGIPKAILTYDVVSSGAGDEQIRPIISGEVITEKLIITSGGDQQVDNVVKDLLRNYGLIALDTKELAIQDNQ